MTSDSASTGKLPTLKENSALPASVSSPTPSNKVPTTRGRAARKSIYRAKVAFPEDLPKGTNLELGSDVVSMQNVLSWKSRSKLGIDLDITAITYDLKGRFSEIIGFDSPTSHDASIALAGDEVGGSEEEMIALDLSGISPKIRASWWKESIR